MADLPNTNYDVFELQDTMIAPSGRTAAGFGSHGEIAEQPDAENQDGVHPGVGEPGKARACPLWP
jgi:hypothetical protein